MKYLVVFVVFALGTCNGDDAQPRINGSPAIDVNNITHPSDAPITEINPPTSIPTTVKPITIVPTSPTTTKQPPPSPQPTTPNPHEPTTTPKVITTTASTVPPKTTTLAPNPTPTPSPPNSTSVQPPTDQPAPLPVTTVAPSHNRKFDGPSFVGGIVLALGMVAIAFVAFKFYKARTELNYHTL